MNLKEFQKIYFVEWLHRMIGSSLGGLFGIPFAYFFSRGYLYAPMRNRLLFLLGLGGT